MAIRRNRPSARRVVRSVGADAPERPERRRGVRERVGETRIVNAGFAAAVAHDKASAPIIPNSLIVLFTVVCNSTLHIGQLSTGRNERADLIADQSALQDRIEATPFGLHGRAANPRFGEPPRKKIRGGLV